MIPFSCSHHDCFQFPSRKYTINNELVYNCDLHQIKCSINKCNKVPKVFHKHNKQKLYYCKKHSYQYQPIFCHRHNCDSIATYNYNDKTEPWYCHKHKAVNMTIVTTTCIKFGCHSKANYNFINRMKELEKPKGIYCTHHKKRKMISVQDFINGYKIKEVTISGKDTIKPIDNTTNLDAGFIEPTISIIYDIRKDDKVYLLGVLQDYEIIDIDEINNLNK